MARVTCWSAAHVRSGCCAALTLSDDGIEACMMAHPAGGDNNGIDGVIAPNLAVRRLNIEFHGKSAHAALAPWQGINALDAAVQAYTAINAMRQHIQSHERIHGVILNGGESPNGEHRPCT